MLAQAGSTTALAGGEIVLLHPKSPVAGAVTLSAPGDSEVLRVNMHDIESGRMSKNVPIRDGDTIFVPKADRFFVVGLVRNPGSYALEANMTVLQALSLAGGVTERGSSRRLRVTRVVGRQAQGNRRQGDRPGAARRHHHGSPAFVVRLLFLSPTGQHGGAEAALFELLAGLRERCPDWRLSVVAASDGPLIDRVRALGVIVTVLPFPARLARVGEWAAGTSGLRQLRLAAACLAAAWGALGYACAGCGAWSPSTHRTSCKATASRCTCCPPGWHRAARPWCGTCMITSAAGR